MLRQNDPCKAPAQQLQIIANHLGQMTNGFNFLGAQVANLTNAANNLTNAVNILNNAVNNLTNTVNNLTDTVDNLTNVYYVLHIFDLLCDF